jgi:glutamyl-tRNA synthetase
LFRPKHQARQAGGTFVLRIEDTDTARSTRASEESMKADLRWLGLDWDEGPDVGGPHAPYRQSERGAIYQKYSAQLIAEGKAYPCFTTEAELDDLRAAAEAAGEPSPVYDGTWRDADPALVAAKIAAGDTFAVRFKVEPGSSVSINDLVRGTVSWDADATVGDFVLMRSTGVPVYNFCVAVDDATMGITHVVRAEEHLTNTLRQGLVLEALGFPMPTYAHASLILGEDRSKLSKRHGATSVDQFKQEGYVLGHDQLLGRLGLVRRLGARDLLAGRRG